MFNLTTLLLWLNAAILVFFFRTKNGWGESLGVILGIIALASSVYGFPVQVATYALCSASFLFLVLLQMTKINEVSLLWVPPIRCLDKPLILLWFFVTLCLMFVFRLTNELAILSVDIYSSLFVSAIVSIVLCQMIFWRYCRNLLK